MKAIKNHKNLASNHAFCADIFLRESILLLFLGGLNFLFLKSISKFLKIYMNKLYRQEYCDLILILALP